MSLRFILLFSFLIAGLSISSPVSALITSDEMKTNILKIYDKNVLVLNRGLEDGIFKGDHIKMTNDEGFIARGICLKTSLTLSHWKIYRVVRPELVGMDSTYTLHSMNQSEIPRSLKGYREVDFSGAYDYSEEDANKGLKLQQERLANYDLPESIVEKGGYPKKEEGPKERDFFAENFNRKNLERDFSTLQLSMFASPISWETLNQQKNMYFGFNLKNRGKKYDFALQGEQRQTKIVNRYTQEEVEKLYRRVDSTFTIKDFSDKWSYFVYGLYESEEQGDIKNPIAQVNLAPVAFYRHFQKPNEDGEEFKLGFAPMLDNRKFETLDGDTQERNNARLGFHLYYTELLTPTTSFRADFWYSPYLDLSDQSLDTGNTRTNLKAILNRSLGESFSVEYQVQYLKDILYKRDLGVQPENIINTINFRLTTDL